MAAAETVWRAFPRQAAFMRRTESEVLFGGAAGPGKSEALLMLAIQRCVQYPGAHVLYLRRELDDLRPSAIKKSLEVLSGTGPTFNQSLHTWKFPNGSELRFGHAQYEHDVLAYKSQEYDLICLDEMTEFTPYQYDFLKTRNRSTKVPSDRWWMRGASNPGGVGHGWVKTYFIDICREQVYTDPRSGRTRIFIPARIEDNPVYAADGEYARILDGIADPDLRRAMREGDWDIFAGQAFPEWRYDIHTCDPFTVPDDWLRFTSTDWGHGDDCATLWWAVDPDSNLWVYRERVESGYGSRETARAILDLSEDEDIDYNAIGDDVDQQRDKEPTIGELMRKEGFRYRPIPRHPKSRASSKQLIHDWLKVRQGPDDEPTARLRVFRSCLRLCKEMPALVRDPRKPEDVAHSDIYDSLRYGVMSRPRPAAPQAQKTAPGTLQHVLDLARRAREQEEAAGWKGY